MRRSWLNSFSVLRGCPSCWYDLNFTILHRPHQRARVTIASVKLVPRVLAMCYSAERLMSFCLLLQLGCFGVLALLSEAYPVARYPVAWGCDVSLNCMSPLPTHSGGSGSAPPRPSSPSMACTGGGGPLAITVGCMTSSWLAYDLSAHSQLIKVVIK